METWSSAPNFPISARLSVALTAPAATLGRRWRSASAAVFHPAARREPRRRRCRSRKFLDERRKRQAPSPKKRILISDLPLHGRGSPWCRSATSIRMVVGRCGACSRCGRAPALRRPSVRGPPPGSCARSGRPRPRKVLEFSGHRRCPSMRRIADTMRLKSPGSSDAAWSGRPWSSVRCFSTTVAPMADGCKRDFDAFGADSE